MSLTLDQVRTFVVVADELNFQRAADRLNLTQPPVSRQIQLLERNLGAQLFDRTRRKIELTAAGRSFRADAERILRLVAASQARTAGAADGSEGIAAIGYTSVVANAFLPRLLQIAQVALPNVTVQLTEMLTADQPDALLSGALDIGMCRPTDMPVGLRSAPLPDDRLILALPDQWAGEDDGPVDLAAVGDHPFIAYAPDGPAYFRDLVAAALRVHEIEPRTAFAVPSVYTMLRLVSSGLGSAIVPESSRSWGPEGVTYHDLPELDAFRARSNLVWSADNLNPVLPKLVEAFSELTSSE